MIGKVGRIIAFNNPPFFKPCFLPRPSPYYGVHKVTKILRNDCVHEIVQFPRASHYVYYVYTYYYIQKIINEGTTASSLARSQSYGRGDSQE